MGKNGSKCKYDAPENRLLLLLLLLLYLFTPIAAVLTCAAGHERCIKAELTLHSCCIENLQCIEVEHRSVTSDQTVQIACVMCSNAVASRLLSVV